MRIDKSEFPKEGLIEYLVENKKRLIAVKKSAPVQSANLFSAPIFDTPVNTAINKQSDVQTVLQDKIMVTTIANTAGWMDSHDDVIGKGAYAKTIAEKGPAGANLMYHLFDHKFDYEHKLGEVKDVYTKIFDPEFFGIESDVKEIESLVFHTELHKDRNPVMFREYILGGVKQHSIGLQYVNLNLAVNDPEHEAEFAVWEKHFSEIVNKEHALDKGYFWYSSEIKVFENSAVLLGANSLTPTESVGKNIKPSADTYVEPSQDIQSELKQFYINLLK